ncbi:DIMBOA UDP-glucosyltransferase BX9-like [Phragmites australis]|uniref:DIMBOA UDP-glucosyltransferase BX9-like n=1 Tax=Phragmites australis TaxID=29695 RepID=UPI002D780EE4|nr:DIMBOA UDP-glucosyltransferase BX9-like [Phragmites australis]
MAATASSGESQRRRRVLMFPLPFQGHLNPMLQLAGALHACGGLDVTVFHAAFNAPDPAGHRFVPVGDGVPFGGLLPSGSDADFAGALLRMNERLRGPFRDSLRQVLDEDEGGASACLVVDSNLRGMQLVAEELGVPTLVLRTGSAACLVAYMAFPALCDKGLLPPPSQDQIQLDMPLNELPPLRLRDMVFSTTTTHATMARCLECLLESARCSSGVIINTLQDLESSELQKIANGLGVPIYAIGPLHKISSGTESSLLAQDRTCMEWLDKQETDSVLYVSFGSLASMDEKELLETAWGLANSQRPFLWVIRHNLVQSSEQASLPDGFEEATRGRGMVVSWAPQQDVLGHRAVGGFWTHNGWNSTLESICEGVPMICRPQFADQMINMRYVQEVWKIGFELEGELERGKIEGAVRRLLCEEEGREMRQRAKDFRNKAVNCMDEGGSSKTAIDLLLKRIMSF